MQGFMQQTIQRKQFHERQFFEFHAGSYNMNISCNLKFMFCNKAFVV